MPFCPPRITGFSYVGPYQYFVTACTPARRKYFLEEQHARDTSSQIPPFFARYSFDVIAYCLMPDHAHLLLEGASDAANFREAMRQWKQQTAHAWKRRTGQRLWQAGYYDRVLREKDDPRAVVAYLLHNPVRAGLAVAPADWPWTGSARYSLSDLSMYAGDWNPPWK